MNGNAQASNSARLEAAYQAAASVNTAELAKGLTGLAIREAIAAARVKAIEPVVL